MKISTKLPKPPKLQKEVYVAWIFDGDEYWLSVSQSPEESLDTANESRMVCGRYVFKEEVFIERKTEIKVRKGKS
jgi:hypothetical protein